MAYVDGFVCPVPVENKESYLAHARETGEYFIKYGAIEWVECWGNDVPDGEVTSFPLAVKLKPGETAVFAWIVWPSKEVRDEGMAKLMEEPIFSDESIVMPFDGKRMIMGGFDVIAHGKAG